MNEPTNSEALPPTTGSLAESLAEWIEYVETRANELDRLTKENEKYPEARARLETKAGCYRSLAIEAKRILKENSELS